MKKALFAMAGLGLVSGSVAAEDLYRPGSWVALASDRRASAVGDIVTVIISESAQAQNRVTRSGKKRSAVDGSISAGTGFDKSGSGSLGGSYAGEGDNGRSDRLIARMSTTIFDVLPNGDLLISGPQRLNVNGETTLIKVSGRIRRDDISRDNTVVSTRIADAVIEYDGRGFSSRSAKPGLVTKIFNYLGLI